MFSKCISCAPIQSRTTHSEESKKRYMRDIRKTYESLTPDERELVDDDIKGTRNEIEETPNFIAEKLQEFEQQLELLPDDAQIAYKQAVAMEMNQENGEEYIRSKRFRLMFLRAEEYNAQMAARRIARYFEHKKELFGYKNLARRIKQSDLSETDKEVMLSGCYCSTGATDIHGRLVVYVCRHLRDSFTVNSTRRSIFYLFQILENNEEWQKKGIVFVADARELNTPKPSSEMRLYPFRRMLLRGLPCRVACLHLCYNSMVAHYFLKLALVVVPANVEARVVTHYENTSPEIFSCLLPYGIDPEDDLPLNTEWKFQREMVAKFLDTLKEKEESEDS